MSFGKLFVIHNFSWWGVVPMVSVDWLYQDVWWRQEDPETILWRPGTHVRWGGLCRVQFLSGLSGNTSVPENPPNPVLSIYCWFHGLVTGQYARGPSQESEHCGHSVVCNNHTWKLSPKLPISLFIHWNNTQSHGQQGVKTGTNKYK